MKERSFSRLSSDTISALRFPLMVGIVSLHFVNLVLRRGVTIQGVDYGTNPPYWLVCINNLFSDVLPRIGVPLFFLMSGYLFFLSGLTGGQYKAKLRKRARTLLVPYILWNTVYILYAAMGSLPMFHSLSPRAVPVDWSPLAILSCFWDRNLCVPDDERMWNGIFPLCGQMWYVRDLMIMMVLAPLFHGLIRKAGWLVVVALGVAWYFMWADMTLGHLRQLIDAAFFFSWGACLAIKGIDFVKSMRRFGFALWLYPVIAIADMLTKEWAYSGYLHEVGIILGIFAAVSLVANLLEKGKIKVNKFLAAGSFFIFALHLLFLDRLEVVFVKLYFVDSSIYWAALSFIVPITMIAICLGLYWCLQRFAPRLCALLTGGR